MPKLGLGINLDARASGSSSGPTKSVTLFESNFVSWPTNPAGFTQRQFFSSGLASAVTWGSGFLANSTVGNNSHILCYFDCLKDLYPAYNNGVGYALNDIVYGGIYGHALFKRTGNVGNPGYPPNFLFTPSGNQDASGWSRFRPSLRTIAAGKTLSISFSFTGASPGTIGSNSFRFGFFDSTIGGTKTYINQDDLGLSNVIYSGNGVAPGYRGYMTTLAGAQRLHTRTDTSAQALINTISGTGTIWTQNITANLIGLALDTKYSVILKATRPVNTPTSLTISSTISGGGITGPGGVPSPTVSYTDVAPSTFSFDTFAAYMVAGVGTSLKIENMKATYG